ncbi:hypothetical protein DN402_15920 [Streptomyces sp. SW4]|nr:hypothetical protein DN402_15920 [Streptomyces sp. SW4]
MVRDHGFGCVPQMQGQMHVHVTELAPPVPLVGQFFRHLRVAPRPSPDRFPLPLRPNSVRTPSEPARFLRLDSVSVTARVLLGVF